MDEKEPEKKLKKISESELEGILKKHKLWLESNGNRTDPNRANFALFDLKGAKLIRANLTRVHFREADLTGANLNRADLNQANLTRVDLTRAFAEKADLTGANLKKANLTGAYFTEAYFIEADLSKANLSQAKLWNTKFTKANLKGTDLTEADLSYTDLTEANLTKANLTGADLTGAKLNWAKLNGAKLNGAKLNRAELTGTNFEEADLRWAKLTQTHIRSARLREGNLRGADLRSTHFSWADLKGTNCAYVVVDGETMMENCHIDDHTDFTGVGLDNARLEPGLKQRLEYNIRRKRWKSWYQETPWWKSITVKWFWELSNYGISTGRIIGSFLILSFIFSMIYWLSASCPCPPSFNPESCECTLYAWADTNTYEVPASSCNNRGLIKNLLYDADTKILFSGWSAFWRSLYFSVVTMTTLGFGDMHAMPGSLIGYLVLSIQVIIGYVLLGALITRLSILFTSDGPAKDFSKKTDDDSPDVD